MLSRRVLGTIRGRGLLNGGERVVAGVSGGPDSVCLLHILHSVSDELGIKLFAVHVNHMLRGSEADRDQEYVREFCTRLGVPLYESSVDVGALARQKGISIEEAGREARYRELERYALKAGASAIAVAHNKNDQAETVLMNILRGTGLDGLKGMEYRNGIIIRPLLDIERREIEEYCAENGLNPRVDGTNLLPVYTRNKVRLELIPYIEKLFGTDITAGICRLSAIARDDIGFLECVSRRAYSECRLERAPGRVALDTEGLKKLHEGIRKRVVRMAVEELKGDLKGLEHVHVENVIDLASKGRTGSRVHLPCGIRAGISYGRLVFRLEPESEGTADFEKPLEIPGTTFLGAFGGKIEAAVDESPGGRYLKHGVSRCSLDQIFDYEKLKKGINIRNRREGDVFKPFKSKGTKKLKEYMIDKKIPREIRDAIPLAAQGKEIIWIIGYDVSDKFIADENTNSVLKLEYYPQD